jgi:hypothetical protein
VIHHPTHGNDTSNRLPIRGIGEVRSRSPARMLPGALEMGPRSRPLHGETSDPELASYFVASVPSHTADVLAARLRTCPGVAAAYAKPAGAPPDERM